MPYLSLVNAAGLNSPAFPPRTKMTPNLFDPPRAPRPPRRYDDREVQGYAIAIVIFAVAVVLLAIALRIATHGI